MLGLLPRLFAAYECNNPNTDEYCTGLPQAAGNGGSLQDILQIAIGVAAALAVLFIVIGGLRYVTSAGDPQGAGKARSTIIFALVGLIIAVFAEAIVTFAIKDL